MNLDTSSPRAVCWPAHSFTKYYWQVAIKALRAERKTALMKLREPDNIRVSTATPDSASESDKGYKDCFRGGGDNLGPGC